MKKKINPKKNESDTFHEAVKGANATLEYAGLVSWSIISRSSAAIIDEILKITETVGRNAAEPFFEIKKQVRKVFGKKIFVGDYKIYVDEKVKVIEEGIRRLEGRLAFLEKHGVRLSGVPEYEKKKKELNDERKGLINMIVQENKRLRELLNP